LSSKPKADKAKPAQPPAKGAKPAAAGPKPAPEGALYIDATGHIAGRLASVVAHEVIRGKRVVVLNSEKAVISGDRKSLMRQWSERLELGSKVNPMYGPFHPRRPDNIMWRMVRGMVPKTKAKGIIGLKRVRFYIGVPEKYSGYALTKVDDALATRPLPTYTTIAEISKTIGWNG